MYKGRAKNGRDLCDNAQPKASASSAIDIVFFGLARVIIIIIMCEQRLHSINNLWYDPSVLLPCV